jgi:Vanadium chloroperoxidase N-terminal domain
MATTIPGETSPELVVPDLLPADASAAAPATTRSNVIRDWNAVALNANAIDHTTAGQRPTKGPTGSARALAIMHLAMHDAYFSIAGGHDPYMPGLPAPPTGASAEGAAGEAAREALKALYPGRSADFDHEAPHGSADDRAHGGAVAGAILADRATDPDPFRGYEPLTGPGEHRVDPANPDQGYYGAYVGATRPFALRRGSSYELDAPPGLGSTEYLRALREVRGKGILPELAGTVSDVADLRTAHETILGYFWAYDGPAGIGTPPRLYNQIVVRVAEEQGNSVAEDARLFALVNTAMADAGFRAWHDKYEYRLLRPVIGIREHDRGGDPMWLPLGAPRTLLPREKHDDPSLHLPPQAFTPPFPAYPSGHATFGAAALQSVRLFYGRTADGPDDLFPGTFASDELDGRARDERGYIRPRYERPFPGGLWQMIEENGRSRVYLGVHWVFDAFAVDAGGNMDLDRYVGGVPLGLRVARDLAAEGALTRTPTA